MPPSFHGLCTAWCRCCATLRGTSLCHVDAAFVRRALLDKRSVNVPSASFPACVLAALARVAASDCMPRVLALSTTRRPP